MWEVLFLSHPISLSIPTPTLSSQPAVAPHQHLSSCALFLKACVVRPLLHCIILPRCDPGVLAILSSPDGGALGVSPHAPRSVTIYLILSSRQPLAVFALLPEGAPPVVSGPTCHVIPTLSTRFSQVRLRGLEIPYSAATIPPQKHITSGLDLLALRAASWADLPRFRLR